MDIIPIIGVTVIALGAYIVVTMFYPMLTGGAGYTVTPKKIAAEALNLVELKKDDVFFDLGCGTGEVLAVASKLCDNVNGIEIDPVRCFIARRKARKAHVILGNLFEQDISNATVIFIFQYGGKINTRIVEKIKADTRSGTRVVSYYWPIENLKLFKSQKKIFVYKT